MWSKLKGHAGEDIGSSCLADEVNDQADLGADLVVVSLRTCRTFFFVS